MLAKDVGVNTAGIYVQKFWKMKAKTWGIQYCARAKMRPFGGLQADMLCTSAHLRVWDENNDGLWRHSD